MHYPGRHVIFRYTCDLSQQTKAISLYFSTLSRYPESLTISWVLGSLLIMAYRFALPDAIILTGGYSINQVLYYMAVRVIANLLH